jgi:hypothetical protein
MMADEIWTVDDLRSALLHVDRSIDAILAGDELTPYQREQHDQLVARREELVAQLQAAVQAAEHTPGRPPPRRRDATPPASGKRAGRINTDGLKGLTMLRPAPYQRKPAVVRVLGAAAIKFPIRRRQRAE